MGQLRERIKFEYLSLSIFFVSVARRDEGKVLKRRELIELYMAVATPLLVTLIDQDRSGDLKFYLNQCLNRSLSFEDFYSVVLTQSKRRVA